jgi:hypothetical protein
VNPVQGQTPGEREVGDLSAARAGILQHAELASLVDASKYLMDQYMKHAFEWKGR